MAIQINKEIVVDEIKISKYFLIDMPVHINVYCSNCFKVTCRCIEVATKCDVDEFAKVTLVRVAQNNFWTVSVRVHIPRSAPWIVCVLHEAVVVNTLAPVLRILNGLHVVTRVKCALKAPFNVHQTLSLLRVDEVSVYVEVPDAVEKPRVVQDRLVVAQLHHRVHDAVRTWTPENWRSGTVLFKNAWVY